MHARIQNIKAYLKWFHFKSRNKAVRFLCSRFYKDGNRDIRNSIIVAGAGRSGTTWVADIIASQLPCRIMFEPFHSEKVEAFGQFSYFLYMRPQESNPALLDFAERILLGNIRNPWIDSEVDRIFPKFRLIKEIRANLFLKWLSYMFPDVPIVFVVRHPCAVVLSRLRAGWATDEDIQAFLSQEELMGDFLSDKMQKIRKATTDEEKHAIIWCIQHLVPFRQFLPGELQIIYYENLCLQPEKEVSRIFKIIKHEHRDNVFRYLRKPSNTTAIHSAILSGEDKIKAWKKYLSNTQIDNILSVVRDFGVDYIYGDSFEPITEVVKIN